MNKFVLFLMLILTTNCYATDVKLTSLTEDTSPAITDLTMTVSDPSGSPTSKKVKIQNLFKPTNITVNGTNVGIGSVNPTQRLDVSGVVKATTFSGSGASLTALPAAQISGVIPIANLATGTPDGTKFIKDDGTLAVPSGGGGTAAGGTNAVQYNSGSSTFAGDETKVSFNGTNVGIGTVNGTKLLDVRGDINIGGTADRTLSLDRNTGAAAGKSLTITAGGATSASTDKAGGNLILQAGQSTGNAAGDVVIRASKTAGTSGTGDNIISDRIWVHGGTTITNNVQSALFDVTGFSSIQSGGGTIIWEIVTTDGTDVQSLSGMTNYALIYKSGTWSSAITENVSNEAKVVNSGTITATFAVTVSGTTATINVTVASSLVASAAHPRINFVVINNDYHNLTMR